MKEYLKDAHPELNFDDWNHTETLTVVYRKVSREVKDDFYTNQFDGEVSDFYMKDKDIICGVLGKPVERTQPSGKIVKGVRVCGIYYNRNRYDVVRPLLEEYVTLSVKGMSTGRIWKPYKQKYFFVEAIPDNDEQIGLLESLGFNKDNKFTDAYYKKI